MQRILVVFIIATFIAATVCAENKLRTDTVTWKEISTEHFTIVYPKGILQKAWEAGFYLEEGFKGISKELDVKVKNKIPVILYLSHNHFEQNNILPGSVPEGVAAFAEVFKDRIALPVVPSKKEFKYLLQHELTHILEFAALYPRRMPSFYLIRSPFYPDWFMEGLAEYSSDYNSTFRNMIMRDRALDSSLLPMNKLFGFSHLNRHDVTYAYKQSGEFIRFLYQQNQDNPKKLLRTFADHMPWKISSIIQAACGKDYKEIDSSFRNYIEKRWIEEIGTRDEPLFENRLTGREQLYYNVYDTDAVYNPRGKTIAYFSDIHEKTNLFVMNSNGSDPRALFDKKINFSIEKVHRGNGGSIAWNSAGTTLFFVGEWKNRDYIYKYNMFFDELQKFDFTFDAIRDIASSPDDIHIVFSGIKNGISDIYAYNVLSKKVVRLTDDEYDDYAPTWNPKRHMLVYTSERDGQKDLVMIKIDANLNKTGEIVLTGPVSDEESPSWNSNGDKIVFISNMDGFYDIYVYDISKHVIYKQTSFIGGCFQPTYDPEGENILFSYFRHRRYSLYTIPASYVEDRKVKFSVIETLKADLEHYSEGEEGDEKARKFKNTFSWDYILPFGLFNWGQAGDILSDHLITGAIYPRFASKGSFFSGSIMYWNLKTRFDIGIGVQTFSASNIEAEQQTDDQNVLVQIKLPFDAYRSITGGVIAGTRKKYEKKVKISDKERRGVFGEITHDNRLYRGVDPIRGQLFSIGGEVFPGEDLDTERYGYIFGVYEQAFSLKQDHILYFSLMGDLSAGRDKIELDLAEKVRGYSSGEVEGYKRVAGSIECRFPVYRDANFSVLGHYMLLKDFRGFVFADIAAVSSLGKDDFLKDAFAFDLDFRHSLGAGIQIDFYGMQKAPISIKAGFAKVTDHETKGVWAFFDFRFEF